VSVLASTANAAFQTPDSNTNGWGGWTRGDVGTLYAEWDNFNTYPTDSTPDVGSFNTTSSSITETTGAAFITNGGFGNIYSPTVATDFDIFINGALASGPVQVAVQLFTIGAEYGLFQLNGQSADSVIETRRESIVAFGQPTFSVDTLLLWNLTDIPASGFNFDLSAAASSMSLAGISFDIGSTAPVPLPAAAWMLLSGILGMGFFGRRSYSSVS